MGFHVGAFLLMGTLLDPQRAKGVLSGEEIAARAGKAVVAAVCINGDETGYGTGFAIEPIGLVATNAHVASPCQRIVVVRADIERDARLIALDADRDIAILHVPALAVRPLPLGSSRLIKPGQKVYAVGNPKEWENTISDGIISSVRDDPTIGRWIQTTAPISPGSSGGPLLNTEGYVVGMTSFFMREGQNLNFAVPAEFIAEVSRQAAKWIRDHPARSAVPSALPPVVTAESAAALGRSLRKAKDHSRARAVLDAALDRYPDHLALLSQLAELHLDQLHSEQAFQLAGRILEISPNSSSGHRLLAAALFQKGETAEARIEAMKALALSTEDEDSARAHLVLADCAARVNDFSMASEHLGSALQHEDTFEDPVVHARHAVALSQLRRFDEADEEARTAVAIDPENAYVKKLLKPLGLPRGARIVSILDEWDSAQRYFVKGVATNHGSIPLEGVRVIAELHDPKSVLIGTGQGYVDPLKLGPGESGSFRIQVVGAFNPFSALPESHADEYPNPEKILGPRPRVTVPVLGRGGSLANIISSLEHQKQIAAQEDWDIRAADLVQQWWIRRRTRAIAVRTGNTYRAYVAPD